MMIKEITKTEYVREVLLNYEHNWHTEGEISLRRLWYILKDKFYQLPHFEFTETINGKPKVVKYLKGFMYNYTHNKGWVQMVTSTDLNKHFNYLAKQGLIDDTYISDNSRKMNVGSLVPHIIIIGEKDAIEPPTRTLFEKLGISYYISKGFSSVYGAKKLIKMIRGVTSNPLILLIMTDYDKSGLEIQRTVMDHFGDPESYRMLLNPEHLPEDKLDRFFEEKDGERWYELDILNRLELFDTFLKHLPNHVSDQINEGFEKSRRQTIQDIEIEDTIDSDPDVKSLEDELYELRQKLFREYEPRFIEADPIEFSTITPRTIFDREVRHTVGYW